MKRSYNYTSRQKIDVGSWEFRIQERETAPSELTVSCNHEYLSAWGENCHLFIEAYYGNNCMRFSIQPPYSRNSVTFALSSFSPDEYLRIRVKIVDVASEYRKILASRDGINPRVYDKTGRKKSILPVKSSSNLGNVVWKLDLSEEDLPVLLINSKLRDADNIGALVTSDPAFMALVFPQVIQDVLQYFLFKKKLTLEELEDNPWMTFAEQITGSSYTDEDDDEEKERWIGLVIEKFCQKFKLFEKYMNARGAK